MRWQCSCCGYKVIGTKPRKCPVCKVKNSMLTVAGRRFEAAEEV